MRKNIAKSNYATEWCQQWLRRKEQGCEENGVEKRSVKINYSSDIDEDPDSKEYEKLGKEKITVARKERLEGFLKDMNKNDEEKD